MQYNISKLKREFKNGEDLEFYFFQGYLPSSTGELTETCLSSWWMQPFEINLQTYCCVEQWVMAQIASMYKEYKAYEVIMKTTNPIVMRTWGENVIAKHMNGEDINTVLYNLYYQGNNAKFRSNKSLQSFLLSTNDKILVYVSANDNVRGVKSKTINSKLFNPNNWDGQNLLGFSLMETREDIRELGNIVNKEFEPGIFSEHPKRGRAY